MPDFILSKKAANVFCFLKVFFYGSLSVRDFRSSLSGFTPLEKNPNKHSSLTGFTLIELLIVIAIIGILVAAIAPRYVGFTQNAKEAATQSSLASLRGALSLYTGENSSYPGSSVDLSPLTPVYIDQLPNNKLIDTNAVAADCSTSAG